MSGVSLSNTFLALPLDETVVDGVGGGFGDPSPSLELISIISEAAFSSCSGSSFLDIVMAMGTWGCWTLAESIGIPKSAINRVVLPDDVDCN